ncbi:MAG TPA: methyl-accepting chemotaxis protein [Thermoanaerobaculia bacterium]|nr:methyl-accepting chemotaxis protein [Thermoanaerobaculia bacterium]
MLKPAPSSASGLETPAAAAPLPAHPASATGRDLVPPRQAEEPSPAESPQLPQETDGRRRPAVRRGLGLNAKILLLLGVILAALTAVAGVVMTFTLEQRMSTEFQSKGEAIARSLANSAVDLVLNRDASTIQSLIDQFADIEGVAYVLVYDPQREIIAHTFSPFIPPGIVTKNEVPGEAAKKAAQISIADPQSGRTRSILDIGVPVLAGRLGTVRVGMDLDLIAAAARRAALYLVALLVALALVAFAVGSLLARRLVRPIDRLVGIAERVGRGDLGELAPVESNDEIGRLSLTWNDAIVRLRDLVETEEDRDRERRQREELQANISRFLRVTTEIARGDLTQRGEVTADVLGSVVDSINVMVEEIGEILAGVRQAADTVSAAAREMIGATDQMVVGAQSQSEDARRVSVEVDEVTQSVRAVAGSAEASAGAARQTLDAAEKGRLAVGDTLSGMQRIRAEVQAISRRIKGLGDRSLEISEIADTISGIAAQTNLLSLNAAIEAAGAGEAGTRFAVVADEVRRLAESSAKATQRIAALIKRVQSEIQDAATAMEAGTHEVEAGFQVARQAGDRLQEIARLTNVSAELAQQISAGTRVQVSSVEKVAQGIVSITVVAARTERSVADGRELANQLVQLAQDLSERLARFKLAS